MSTVGLIHRMLDTVLYWRGSIPEKALKQCIPLLTGYIRNIHCLIYYINYSLSFRYYHVYLLRVVGNEYNGFCSNDSSEIYEIYPSLFGNDPDIYSANDCSCLSLCRSWQYYAVFSRQDIFLH